MSCVKYCIRYLSFPRRRESRGFTGFLDSRFHGNDVHRHRLLRSLQGGLSEANPPKSIEKYCFLTIFCLKYQIIKMRQNEFVNFWHYILPILFCDLFTVLNRRAKMIKIIICLVVIGVYFLMQLYILPKFGIST